MGEAIREGPSEEVVLKQRSKEQEEEKIILGMCKAPELGMIWLGWNTKRRRRMA